MNMTDPPKINSRDGDSPPTLRPIRRSHAFQAYHVTERLKLKEVAKLFDLKPLVFKPTVLGYGLGQNAQCFIYNFGSIVFFNVEKEAQSLVLGRLKNILTQAEIPTTTEDFLLEEDPAEKPAVYYDRIVLNEISADKINLLALVLAQSVALDYFERAADDLLARFSSFSMIAGAAGRRRMSEKTVLELFAKIMGFKQEILGTLYVLEKPEETWDNKTLDELHQEASVMFELKERFRTLDYKLQTLQENLQIVASFSNNRQLLNLEWAIVGLFILDVLLVLYDILLK